jgi:hypothetical protein
MSPRRLSLDIHAFARDVVVRRTSIKEIARKHGMSWGYAFKLIKGQHRREVARLITGLKRDLFATTLRETRRQLALLQGKAVHTLDKAMDKPQTSVALGAAKEVLHRALDRDGRGWEECRPLEGPDLTGLSPETKQRILEELGGPMDDEPGGDGYDAAPRAPYER